MSWSGALAEMAEAQASAFGETVRYEHSSLPAQYVTVRSLWGDEELVDGGNGVWVYQAPVSLLAADLVAFGASVEVHPAGELVRHPESWASQEDQRWYLLSASPGVGVWRCLAQRPMA